MKAALFGIAALTLGGIGLSAPASALPVPGGLAGEPLVEKTVMVSRTVRRGPHCRTVVTRRAGPRGVRIVKRRTCH